MPVVIFCCYKDRFVSNIVGNLEASYAHEEPYLKVKVNMVRVICYSDDMQTSVDNTR